MVKIPIPTMYIECRQIDIIKNADTQMIELRFDSDRMVIMARDPGEEMPFLMITDEVADD